VCLENVIYITKQEKVSTYYLGPFLGEFVRAKRKPNFGNVIAWSAKKLDQFLPGADLGFFKHKSNAEGARHARGVWGHAPRKILKSRVSEMRFQAFWR
jgi:hypothetical protein